MSDPAEAPDRYSPDQEAALRFDDVSQGPLALEGNPCVFRLGLSAVDVPSFPPHLLVGRVRVSLVAGPLRTQRTEIQQRCPPPLVFDKHMIGGADVAVGRMVTLFEIEDALGPDVATQLGEWRLESLQAAGLVAAVLDDRLTGEVLLEDVLLLSPSGDHVATIDGHEHVRHFFPRRVESGDRENLDLLAGIDLRSTSADPGLATASRYYAKAIRERPPDSIVSFWTALEALADAGEKPVAAVERMLSEAGLRKPENDDVSVGRLYGLRGQIVHKAVRQHPLIPQAHYMLEALLRGLLRKRIGMPIRRTSWPIQVDAPRMDTGEPIPGDWVAAQTHWHDGELPNPRLEEKRSDRTRS